MAKNIDTKGKDGWLLRFFEEQVLDKKHVLAISVPFLIVGYLFLGMAAIFAGIIAGNWSEETQR